MLQKGIVAALPRTLLVPWYLLSSFLYYHLDESAMTDEAYDALCVRLRQEWAWVKHRHKALVKPMYLAQTTGYAIPRRAYPLIVQSGALGFLNSARDGSLLESLKHIGVVAAPPTKPRVLIRRFPPPPPPPPPDEPRKLVTLIRRKPRPA